MKEMIKSCKTYFLLFSLNLEITNKHNHNDISSPIRMFVYKLLMLKAEKNSNSVIGEKKNSFKITYHRTSS